MANLDSIMRRGILSRLKARPHAAASVADPHIRKRRAQRVIPGGLRLPQYVNLYFNARNAMLYRIIQPPAIASPTELTILRVHPSVMDRRGVVVTDVNAAAGIRPRWHPVDKGLAVLDKEELFAEFWTDSEEHKQRMMAEVLVPWCVPPEYVTGAYVVSEETFGHLPPALRWLEMKVNPYMFFRGPKP